MPKTKDAFALRELAETLSDYNPFLNELGFDIPTYDFGELHSRKPFVEKGSWLDDCRNAYKTIIKFLDGNRANDDMPETNSEFQRMRFLANKCHCRINRLNKEIQRIDNHCNRLSILKDKLSRKILSDNNSVVRKKFSRVISLFDTYQAIQGIFAILVQDNLQRDLEDYISELPKLFAKAVGLKIRTARNKKGLTQAALAELLSINRFCTSRERGSRHYTLYGE